MVSKAIPVDEALPEDVLKFSQEHGIVEYVDKAIKAAREVYADGEPITARLKRDPEYGNLYVEVHVVLRDNEEPETAAEKDSECIDKWMTFLPAKVDNISLSSLWAPKTMKHLEKRAAEPSGVLEQLTVHGVLLPNRDDSDAYLAMHPDLAGLLDGVCKKVRAAFGPTAELSLERYSDPEFDDQYLTLYIRQSSYTPDIIDRIDAVCADFYRPLEAVSGYFLVATDFRRPRGANGQYYKCVGN